MLTLSGLEVVDFSTPLQGLLATLNFGYWALSAFMPDCPPQAFDLHENDWRPTAHYFFTQSCACRIWRRDRDGRPKQNSLKTIRYRTTGRGLVC
jgi:hypothetical protein